MRLISWNLNARRAKAPLQVAALIAREPDIVALQEVTKSTLPILRAALIAGGLTNVEDSFSLAPDGFDAKGPRRYGQITASHYSLSSMPPTLFALPWPERVLSVRVDVNRRALDIHNTHIPPGSGNGWTKIAMLNGIHAALAVSASVPRILCGDFNTPQHETATGEVITWGQRRSSDGSWRVVGTRRGGPGAEWDAGERQVLTGLADYDLIDVYRALRGYTETDSSWVLSRGGKETGRRFDHVFASSALRAVSCSYLHHLRVSGLSDHAPIEVEFDFG